MLACYTYYHDILKCMIEHKKLPLYEINVVGGRFSGKSYSAQEFSSDAIDLYDANGKTINVRVYALRKKLKDAKELYDDFVQTIDRLDVPCTKAKNTSGGGTFNARNGNKIVVDGLYQSVGDPSIKAGLSRCEDAEYIIVYADERYQFKGNDLQAFKEAVRGNKNTKFLFINICNPWSIKHEFIAYCNNNSRFSLPLLKKYGQQIKITTDYVEGEERKKLFHYTNWRVAKTVITKDQIKSVIDLWNTNKKRAISADYGLPGIEEGAVYTDVLPNVVDTTINYPHEILCGGGDVGFGKSKGSGITSFVFMGISIGKCYDVYAEWNHDNKKEELDPILQARQIVEFYIKNISLWVEKNQNLRSPKCVVRVDYSDKAFISILNNESRNARMSHILTFYPCRKLEINDRVVITQYIMSMGRLRISKGCENLWKEFSTAEWDDKVGLKMKRKDDNDHSINAFEYAIEPYMYNMLEGFDIKNRRKDLIHVN